MSVCMCVGLYACACVFKCVWVWVYVCAVVCVTYGSHARRCCRHIHPAHYTQPSVAHTCG